MSISKEASIKYCIFYSGERILRSLLIILFFILYTSQGYSEVDDWSSYGKDSGGGHYSKATEITPENVKNLKKVWTH